VSDTLYQLISCYHRVFLSECGLSAVKLEILWRKSSCMSVLLTPLLNRAFVSPEPRTISAAASRSSTPGSRGVYVAGLRRLDCLDPHMQPQKSGYTPASKGGHCAIVENMDFITERDE
jgi:hypothetical protein